MTEAHPEFGIWIVRPPGFVHSRGFEEVAEALQAGLVALGHSAAIVDPPAWAARRLIVLGGQLIDPGYFDRLPADAVIFNLEQIFPGSPWLEPHYVELLRRFEVWDYSQRNLDELRRLGIDNCRLCGIGYASCLTRIPEAVEDIDVLHYGSMNAHRRSVLAGLVERGAVVRHVFGVFGEDRDRLIARSKIVLNMHFYEGRVFEIVRVSYLLANRRFVVCEYGTDPGLEEPFAGGVAFAPHEELVDTCLRYLADPDARKRISERGFQRYSAMLQADMLRRVLSQPGERLGSNI
ncbi:MAG: glycosyltransferase family 1 protein [Proteobacteria bacterium]|nr:glycosyltransferase family 1 protein [Pseudomonadota bacterium]